MKPPLQQYGKIYARVHGSGFRMWHYSEAAMLKVQDGLAAGTARQHRS
jgi:hypothetical protein